MQRIIHLKKVLKIYEQYLYKIDRDIEKIDQLKSQKAYDEKIGLSQRPLSNFARKQSREKLFNQRFEESKNLINLNVNSVKLAINERGKETA